MTLKEQLAAMTVERDHWKQIAETYAEVIATVEKTDEIRRQVVGIACGTITQAVSVH